MTYKDHKNYRKLQIAIWNTLFKNTEKNEYKKVFKNANIEIDSENTEIARNIISDIAELLNI